MTYENIEKWKRPEHFAAWTDGAPYDGEWYVFLTQHRDSTLLEKSNFERGLELVGDESDTVMIVRESHWAVGWVEWIAIHESDGAALREADEIMGALYDYPVVDDEHYSYAQYNAIIDYWQNSPIPDRMDTCREADVSLFAARRDAIDRELFDYLAEDGSFV